MMIDFLFAFYVVSGIFAFAIPTFVHIRETWKNERVDVGDLVIYPLICLFMAFVPVLNTIIALRVLIEDVAIKVMQIQIKGPKNG